MPSATSNKRSRTRTRKSRTTLKRKRKTASRPTARRSKPKRRVHKTRTSRSSTKRYANSTACITGSFQGNITASGKLCIGNGATCNANVKASNVEIDGAMSGTVTAQNITKLGKRSQVQGTIVTDKFVAANGAAFVGECRIGRLRKAA